MTNIYKLYESQKMSKNKIARNFTENPYTMIRLKNYQKTVKTNNKKK